MPQKVLIIEDCKTIHRVVESRLRGEPIELVGAFDGEAGLAMASSLKPDLILLDVEMPRPDGFEVCRRLKANPETIDIPVIFLTGASSTELKIAGLELGAVDYVTKPFEPAELKARVRAALRTKYLVDLLSKKAMIDGLTGLWNRAYLDQRLAAESAAAARHGHAFACIMADVDHFKRHNDQFGHPFGDEVIRSIAQLLVRQCRVEDVVCRYGGEEFAILTPGVGAEGAARLAERLRAAVASMELRCNDVAVRLTCSFGVADECPATSPSLVHAADQALYLAKRAGRNRVTVAEITAAPVTA